MLVLFMATLAAFAVLTGALAIALLRRREVRMGCGAGFADGACPVCGADERSGCRRSEPVA